MESKNSIYYIHVGSFFSTLLQWVKWRIKHKEKPVFFISNTKKRNGFFENLGWHVVYKSENKESVSSCLKVSWFDINGSKSIEEWCESIHEQITKTILWVSPRQTSKSPAMARLLRAAPLLNEQGWKIFGLGMEFEKSEFVTPIKLAKWLPIKIIEDYGFIISSHIWALKEWIVRGRPKFEVIHSTTFYFFLPDVVTINAITAKWFSIQRQMPLISYKDILEVLIWCPLLIWEKCIFKSPKRKCYLANSDGLGEELLKHIRENDTVKVLANPVNKNIFNKGERLSRRKKIRQKLGFEESDFIAIFVSQGQFRRKGLLLAFESIAKAKAEGIDDLKFLVVGGNKKQHSMLYQIAKKNFNLDESTLIMHPKMKDPREGLSAADMFLFPSYFDSSPNVLLEALAMELPAVVTPFDGAGMYVNDDNGIICDWNPNLLAAAISEIKERAGSWDDMHTGSALDPTTWCKELEETYTKIKERKNN